MSVRPLPRTSLAVTCFGHALVLTGAASALPWRSGTVFALMLTLLALLHVATGVSALLRKPTWQLVTLRTLSVASALAFAIIGWSMAAAALYVAKLYARLGPLVAGIIVFAFVLFALLTLPIAIWGARRTWPTRFRAPERLGAGALLLSALYAFTLPLASSAARGQPVELVDAKLTSDLAGTLEDHLHQEPVEPRRSVAGAGVATCKKPIVPERLTLLLAYVPHTGGPRSLCIQARNQHDLRRRLRDELERRARPGSTVTLDLVTSVKPLSPTFPLLDVLEVRPGIDGVCEDERCAPAWKLSLNPVFGENRPIADMPEANFGFSADAVRKELRSPREYRGRGIEGLVRIETESISADSSGVHRLMRTRATPPALSGTGVEQVVRSAEQYIERAQEADGSFRYSLDPESGREDRATLNLPRQAGTTYALCELGRSPGLKSTVERALGVFETTEHRWGSLSALNDGTGFGLGKSALPLLSMLRCRELIGERNDRLIGQLTRLVLKLQRADGSFYPSFDERAQRGTGDSEALYAAGQAVLSLVLLEQQREKLAGGAAEPLPSTRDLARVIDRAMDFYGGPYWPRPLRDFYFFEEGWHCLAARHALTSHRRDAYEQLCIDYVASRARFVARSGDVADANFVGGYDFGLGGLLPPRNTATAGFGEALAASIAIKQRRGMDVRADKALMRDVVGFLQRAQWSEAGCYGCQKPDLTVGGFSQMLGAPDIRIDYVQHAMSAVAHGGALLF